MTFGARVIADSVSPNGVRLTTLEVTFPRFVLAEFNTHRVFSRNSASSRAIPVSKRIRAVQENPFVPEAFGKNKKGMQASEDLSEEQRLLAVDQWVRAMREMLYRAGQMAELEVHKQWANRLTEPFAWHTVLVTSTEWENFFALRRHPAAQPEIRSSADLMWEAMQKSEPVLKKAGEWHLPLILPEEVDELDIEVLVMVSAARCARVSYLTHDGRRDIEADLDLYERLASNGHMSPLEHPAQVAGYLMLPMGHQFPLGESDCIRCGASSPNDEKECPAPVFVGNFRAPWVQHRKMIPGEAVFTG